MNKSLTAALICAAVLVVVPPASAGIVPGVAVDGPSALIESAAPRVDVAPDGSAALVYLKDVGGNDHPFVSTYTGGAWSAPVDVDPSIAVATSAPRIAVANGGKVVVTYKKGVAGPLVAQVRPAAGAAFGPAQDLAPAGVAAEVDLAGNGSGSAAGSDNGDIFARRLEGTTWTAVTPPDLDKAPAQQAGFDGNTEARLATAPDGSSAVVAWAETVGGGPEIDVFARRLTGTTAGTVNAGAHIDGLPGSDPYGPMLAPVADQPDVDIDAAGTAWVVFRQNLTYGGMAKHRALTRPFSGDMFGGAQLVDAMPELPPEGRDLQRIDVNDAGQGLITHHGNLTSPLEFASLAGGTWTKGGLAEPAANLVVPQGSPALGENGSGLISYNFRGGMAEPAVVRGRTTLGGLGAVQTLSNPALGEATGASDAAAGPGAFAAVTFLQVTGLQRSVVAAIVDLPQPPQGQGNPTVDTTAPEVTGLRLSRKRFRLGRALPSAAAVRTGTVIRFRLSEAASVRLSFSRALPGRRAGRACRKPTRRNRARRRCTRFVNVRGAVITRPLGPGARRIKFAGRVSRRRSLRPGPYRLTVTARDQAGNASRPDRARFTLLKKKRRRAPR
jgi:hypothetical protein